MKIGKRRSRDEKCYRIWNSISFFVCLVLRLTNISALAGSRQFNVFFSISISSFADARCWWPFPSFQSLFLYVSLGMCFSFWHLEECVFTHLLSLHSIRLLFFLSCYAQCTAHVHAFVCVEMILRLLDNWQTKKLRCRCLCRHRAI